MIRILLVDDQKSIRERLKSLLETEPDFEIVGMVDNGYDAIEQVKLLLPDVVLMDMEMPDIDGVLATKIIAHSSRKTKVLVLTSYDTNDYVSNSIHAGAKGYILKGAPATEIREAIRFVNRGYMQIAPGLFEKFMPTATNSDGQSQFNAKEVDNSAISAIVNRMDLAERSTTMTGTIQTARPKSLAPVQDFEQPSELILDITALRTPRNSIGWVQAAALVLAGLGMTCSLYLLRQGLNKPTTVPNQQERTEKLHELPFTGKIEPIHVTKIDATSPGFVEAIWVKLGQSVRVGERLLTIRNPEAVKANQAKIFQYQQAVAAQKQAALVQAAQQQQQISRQRQILVGERQAAQERIDAVQLAIANYQRNLAPLRQQLAAATSLANAISQAEPSPVSQKREALARAQAIYDRNSATYERLNTYYQEGAIAQERVEQAEKDMTVALSDLNLARADYEQTVAGKQVAATKQAAQTQAVQLQQQLSLQEQAGQLQQLQAQLKTARADYRQLGIRLAQLQQQSPMVATVPIAKPVIEPISTEITAPIAGTAIELPLAVGDRVFAGSKLLGLANTHQLKIGVDLDPQQAILLKAGQRAIVKIGTDSGESVGKIATISLPIDRSTQRIEVEFTNHRSAAIVGQVGTVYFPK